MSVIRIRLAEPRDDGAVGELLVRAFIEKYSQKMPEVRITARAKCLNAPHAVTFIRIFANMARRCRFKITGPARA